MIASTRISQLQENAQKRKNGERGEKVREIVRRVKRERWEEMRERERVTNA